MGTIYFQNFPQAAGTPLSDVPGWKVDAGNDEIWTILEYSFDMPPATHVAQNSKPLGVRWDTAVYLGAGAALYQNVAVRSVDQGGGITALLTHAVTDPAGLVTDGYFFSVNLATASLDFIKRVAGVDTIIKTQPYAGAAKSSTEWKFIANHTVATTTVLTGFLEGVAVMSFADVLELTGGKAGFATFVGQLGATNFTLDDGQTVTDIES